MAPKKSSKKSEETTENPSLEGDIVFDTMPHAIDSIKSWRKIFENLDYEIKRFLVVPENKLQDLGESELHKIEARPRLTPYNNMISWALERTYV